MSRKNEVPARDLPDGDLPAAADGGRIDAPPTPPPPAPVTAEQIAASEPAEKAKYRLKHPAIVNGHFHGMLIKDGVGETEDASIAKKCLDLGCTEVPS